MILIYCSVYCRNCQTIPIFFTDFFIQTEKLSIVVPSTGKVDTRRLELFSDVESLRYLLKHPLMTSFLEQILSSLKLRYFLEFLLYLGFVIALFMHMGNRYGVFKVSFVYFFIVFS